MPCVLKEPSTSTSQSKFAGKRIHFIGIGGAGMSGLARILLDAGAIVSGSEPTPNSQSMELCRRGVSICREQTGQLLSRQIDLVVRSAAVKDDNPEYQSAVSLEIPVYKYAQFLGQVMSERFGIAVAGTHGKSTTTAMIAYALIQAGVDPSFVVGGTVGQLGHVGSHSGQGDIFVAEACEFDRSFHNLHPKVAVITNVEADHLDCYKDIDEIIESFRAFAELAPRSGLVITSANDANAARAIAGLSQPVETCALGSSAPGTPTHNDRPIAWLARLLEPRGGCPRGEVWHYGKRIGELQPSIPGNYNLLNATMALAACHAAGADLDRCIQALNQFTGVDRRMTPVGTYNGAEIIDDYGHHPTEIRVTLSALREKYVPQRLIVIFQPHQHSRTRLLLNDFAAAFSDADEVVLPPIYQARDSDADRRAVSSSLVAERINQRSPGKAAAMPDFDSVIQHLKHQARTGDLIVTMGAGNVCEISQALVEL